MSFSWSRKRNDAFDAAEKLLDDIEDPTSKALVLAVLGMGYQLADIEADVRGIKGTVEELHGSMDLLEGHAERISKA